MAYHCLLTSISIVTTPYAQWAVTALRERLSDRKADQLCVYRGLEAPYTKSNIVLSALSSQASPPMIPFTSAIPMTW
jgi:hypothetical protein